MEKIFEMTVITVIIGLALLAISALMKGGGPARKAVIVIGLAAAGWSMLLFYSTGMAAFIVGAAATDEIDMWKNIPLVAIGGVILLVAIVIGSGGTLDENRRRE
ncbi:MAG: hypothetical protein ABIJ46_02980, partial [bacterium]